MRREEAFAEYGVEDIWEFYDAGSFDPSFEPRKIYPCSASRSKPDILRDLSEVSQLGENCRVLSSYKPNLAIYIVLA